MLMMQPFWRTAAFMQRTLDVLTSIYRALSWFINEGDIPKLQVVIIQYSGNIIRLLTMSMTI